MLHGWYAGLRNSWSIGQGSSGGLCGLRADSSRVDSDRPLATGQRTPARRSVEAAQGTPSAQTQASVAWIAQSS
ncbi:MAG: hypothetical protein IPO82_16235 [Betaproteobacteria bacterium]|nr:hypothetical protein [Betaproteobacteria bacterium]